MTIDRPNAIALAAMAGLLLFCATKSFGKDIGQWEATDPTVRVWYRSLMQPDNPEVSCCGEADAYWADEVFVRNGKTYARITDDRPDEPLGRPHIPNGTEFEITNNKLKFDRGNPTGHSIIFVAPTGYVWCFVQGTLS